MGRRKQTAKGVSERDLSAKPGVATDTLQDRQSSPKEVLGGVLAQTIAHFFPDFDKWVSQMRDPRDPIRIIYPAKFLLMTGILMFVLKLKSRRQMRYKFATDTMLSNVNALAGTKLKSIEHPDTLNYYLGGLRSTELPKLQRHFVRRLIRMKCLDDYRFNGCFLVAVDGTGIMSFDKKHCDACLTKKLKGKTIYYHTVLEAKLVTANGLAISLMTEYIENPKYGGEKQDCERAAFYRLADKLKQAFPQLSICLLMDSLYACEPVIKICKGNGWHYVITFKEGSMPERYREYKSLKNISAQNALTLKTPEGDLQEFGWVNDLDVGSHKANVLECKQNFKTGEVKTFVWLTDFYLNHKTAADTANQAGRLRWKVENEGFNEQKNAGYEMEHCYSQNWDATKNYYALLQISHLIAQLVEKGDLFTKKVGRSIQAAFGGIRALASYLCESLRNYVISAQSVDAALAAKIQIRFNSS